MLELENVTKTYAMGAAEVRALDGVDLAVGEGEYTAFMGPSGSGKSTLLHVMGFLDRPTAGVYRYGGRDARSLSDREVARIRNREIGFVFQSFNLLPRETALRNVALPLLYARVPDRLARAARALDRVGLGHRGGHRPFELSGGEQQRVAIARALVKEPRLILADEPTGNLDTAAGGAILDILEELHRDGLTVVLITHDEGVGARAGRVVRLVDGKIAADTRAAHPEAPTP